MPGKKLLTLLDSLSRYEMSSLRKYLVSPFFNETEDLVKLFDFLAGRPTGQGAAGLDITEKTTLWRQLFGKRPYDDHQLRRLSSDLTRHVLQFLGIRHYRQHPWRSSIDLLPLLESRHELDKHVDGVERQSRESLDQSLLRNTDFHFASYQLAQHSHHRLEQSGTKIIDYTHLEKADYHLDCFYLIQKLKHYCDALDYRNTLSLQAAIGLFPNFLDWVQQSIYFQEPAVRAHLLVATMLLKPDEEASFEELRQLLSTHAVCFDEPELRSLYIYLFNYCIDTKINRGQSHYMQVLFEVYRSALEQGILFKDGQLLTQDYKNIITVGLHVRAFSWVENFITTFTEKLPTADQENAVNYNLAKVFFAQGHYQRVIGQLREVEYQDIVYALGSKLMLLKTYYELHEYLALDSLIDSFRVYLQRNQTIAKEVKQQYLNVLRFVKKLSNTMPKDRAQLTKIRQQINDCKALADKPWILGKVTELEEG